MKSLPVLFNYRNKPIIFTLLTTILFFVLLSLLYYFIYIYPIVLSKSSLANAKSLASELKMTNSYILLSYQELSGINPSHPEYEQLISGALEAIEKSEKEFLEIQVKIKNANFRGTTKVKEFLKNDFKVKFSEGGTAYKNLQSNSNKLNEFKNANSSLVKVMTYNPQVDLGNLDLSDTGARDAAMERAENASVGLKKAFDSLKDLDHPKKDELSANISIAIGILNDLSKDLKEENLKEAETKRSNFVTSYADVTKNSTEIVRSYLTSQELLDSREERENVSLTIDEAMLQIEELQKNLPQDPLSKIGK